MSQPTSGAGEYPYGNQSSGPPYGTPGYGAPGYGTPAGYGTPGAYDAPAGYGTPPQQWSGPANQITPYAPPAAANPGYPAAAYGYAQPQPQFDAYGRPLSDKSKVVAGVLGIALGGFGAGRFYTGHTGIAVAQLVVTLVTCGLGHFWGLIDGIMLLVNGGTDAQGRILRD
jgi:TM2 domain-containing membrane protein YozV